MDTNIIGTFIKTELSYEIALVDMSKFRKWRTMRSLRKGIALAKPGIYLIRSEKVNGVRMLTYTRIHK